MKKCFRLIFFMLSITVAPGKYAAGATLDSTKKIIAAINGQPVYKDEFEFIKQGLRTNCLTYFTSKYGVYDGADFWQHSFNGEVPQAWLNRKALAACKEQKTVLAVMNKYGFLKGFTYQWFKSKWQQENTSRSNQAKNGGLVYGTVNFDEQTYYAYLMSNALLATKHAIVKQCPFSEKQWMTYYEKIKLKNFKKLPTKQLMLYKCNQDQIIDSLALSFSPASNKTDDLTWGEVYNQSISLSKAGQQTNRFKDADGNECFVKCIAIANNGFFSFQEMTDNVKMLYADEVINRSIKQINDTSVVKTYHIK